MTNDFPAVPSPPAPLTPTRSDDLAQQLGEEFDFHVWIDFRPLKDGAMHWHARRTGWTPDQYLHAFDYDGMRRELIIYTRTDGQAEQADQGRIEREGGANYA